MPVNRASAAPRTLGHGHEGGNAMSMFEIAVLGPAFADRLGIVQQCLQCRSAAGVNAPSCPGFGPGCLVTPQLRLLDAGQIRKGPVY
jgi:hypothetical protein